MTTTADILCQARARIEAPENWTKFVSAKDANGLVTHSTSPDAVCFCAGGALKAASNGSNLYEVYETEAFRTLVRSLPGNWKWVSTFNDADTTTHEDVLALFDRAIEAAS